VKQEDPVWKFLYMNHCSFTFGVGTALPPVPWPRRASRKIFHISGKICWT